MKSITDRNLLLNSHTMAVNVIILDDNELDTQSLLYHLKRTEPDWVIRKIFHCPLEAIEYLHNNKPDVLFSDIEMPGLNGLDLIEKIPDIDYPIVYVTGYQEFAVRAFELSAVDYILKPVDGIRLKKTIDKIKLFRSHNQRVQLETLQHIRKELSEVDPKASRIVINAQNTAQVIKIKKIVRCEASGSYTEVILRDDRKITASKSLKYFETILSDNDFIRVHRSHLVNIEYIDKILKETLELVLTNGEVLPISVEKMSSLISR